MLLLAKKLLLPRALLARDVHRATGRLEPCPLLGTASTAIEHAQPESRSTSSGVGIMNRRHAPIVREGGSDESGWGCWSPPAPVNGHTAAGSIR